MILDFLSLISQGRVVMSLDSHRTVFIYRNWFDLIDVVLTILFSFLNLQITSKLLSLGYRYHKLRKYWGSALGHTRNFNLSKFWYYIVSRICFKRNQSPGLRWSYLQTGWTEEGKRHSEFHLVEPEISKTASTSSVWPSDLREDDMSCAWSFYIIVHTVLKHCTLTNNTMGISGGFRGGPRGPAPPLSDPSLHRYYFKGKRMNNLT